MLRPSSPPLSATRASGENVICIDSRRVSAEAVGDIAALEVEEMNGAVLEPPREKAAVWTERRHCAGRPARGISTEWIFFIVFAFHIEIRSSVATISFVAG